MPIISPPNDGLVFLTIVSYVIARSPNIGPREQKARLDDLPILFF